MIIIVGAGISALLTAQTLVSQGQQVTLIDEKRTSNQGASYSCFACLDLKDPRALLPQSAGISSWLGLTDYLAFDSSYALSHPGFVSKMKSAHNGNHLPSLVETLKTLSHFSSKKLQALVELLDFDLQESVGLLDLADKPVNPHYLEKAQMILKEPSLTLESPFSHALSQKERMFNASYLGKQLKNHLSSVGATFIFDQKVNELIIEGTVVKGVKSGDKEYRADAVILANGVGAVALLPKKLQKAIPLETLTRAIINAPANEQDVLPHYALRHEQSFELAPFVEQLRVAGRWFLGSVSSETIEKEQKRLWSIGSTLVPFSSKWTQARYLSQSVLTTPDGLAVVGKTPFEGLFLNIAGGMHSIDFAMAYSSVCVDALLNRAPRSYAHSLSVSRFL